MPRSKYQVCSSLMGYCYSLALSMNTDKKCKHPYTWHIHVYMYTYLCVIYIHTQHTFISLSIHSYIYIHILKCMRVHFITSNSELTHRIYSRFFPFHICNISASQECSFSISFLSFL